MANFYQRAAIVCLSFLYCVVSINGAASLQGWIFPGDPACGASDTYHQYPIDVLKPQYFNVNDDGTVSVGPTDTCNGYTSSNVADVKAYSKQQFATVACQYTGFNQMIHSSTKTTNAINTFVNTVVSANLTGVEVDCENYEQWTSSDATAFKNFMTTLGNKLHAQGKQLMIDGPAIDTQDTQGGVANFKYEDYVSLPIDYICVMCYDNQLGDGGTGGAVSPDGWTQNVVNWMLNKVGDTNRIVIGIGSYGYHGPAGGSTGDQVQDTAAQSATYPGYSTATRDSSSQELMWTNSGTFYDYSDTVTLDHKKTLIEGMGIKHISVWHLGGNAWFSSSSGSGSAPSSSPTASPSSSSDSPAPSSSPSSSSPSHSPAPTGRVPSPSPTSYYTNDTVSSSESDSSVKKPTEQTSASVVVGASVFSFVGFALMAILL